MRLVVALIGMLFSAVGAVAQTTPQTIQQWDRAYAMTAWEMEAACVQGDLAACGVFGGKVFHGDGVAQNHRRAVPLLEQACEAEFGWACFDLGVAHTEGQGVSSDLRKAHDYYVKACGIGVGAACMNMAGNLKKYFLPEDNGDDPVARERIMIAQALYHACFEARWPGVGSCGGFVNWMSDDEALRAQMGAETGPVILRALEKTCGKDGPGMDKNCAVGKRACWAGVGETCTFFVENRVAQCRASDVEACAALVRTAYEATFFDAEDVKGADHITRVISRPDLDWMEIVAGACPDGEKKTSCDAVWSVCMSGHEAICSAFAAQTRWECEQGDFKSCEYFMSIGLSAQSLAPHAPAAEEKLLETCGLRPWVCGRIGRTLKRLMNDYAHTEGPARRVALALCEQGNAEGCVLMSELAESDQERWNFLNRACKAGIEVNMMAYTVKGKREDLGAKESADACRELGEEIVAVAAKQDGAHADAMLSRAMAYQARACDVERASNDLLGGEISDHCKQIDQWEYWLEHWNATGFRVQDQMSSSYAEIFFTRMGETRIQAESHSANEHWRRENQNACVYYLGAISSGDEAEIEAICRRTELRSYCSSEAPVSVFGESGISCGNIQCLRDAVNGQGRFGLFDPIDGRDWRAVAAACLGKDGAGQSHLGYLSSRP